MATMATHGAARQSSFTGTGGRRASAPDRESTDTQGQRDKIPNFAMLKAVDRRKSSL